VGRIVAGRWWVPHKIVNLTRLCCRQAATANAVAKCVFPVPVSLRKMTGSLRARYPPSLRFLITAHTTEPNGASMFAAVLPVVRDRAPRCDAASVDSVSGYELCS
jgi:hypothetical protein